MKAISIKQPWASLIAHGIKDVENRTWKCPEKYIGQRVLIHASASKKEGYMLKGPLILHQLITYLTMLVNWLNTATPAITRFSSALSGKGTYTK